ncbi:hypothetical protein ACIBHX_02150 [Nonomuraea sp. NPDC050536]|uniref:hypothetical protein n=1 Tax=Nonomuraea sp. NPDC050536 TaxID=3364366 RepID=UPI0037C65268
MADYADLPKDLIELKVAWLQADALCQEISDRLPSNIDVVALEAERDEEGLAELAEARSERLRITDEINAHPYWATCEHRYDAWMHLNKLAKEALAASQNQA